MCRLSKNVREFTLWSQWGNTIWYAQHLKQPRQTRPCHECRNQALYDREVDTHLMRKLLIYIYVCTAPTRSQGDWIPASSQFFNFSSTFNSILPRLLRAKLENMQVDSPLVTWVGDCLMGRLQYVRLQICVSDSLIANWGGSGPPVSATWWSRCFISLLLWTSSSSLWCPRVRASKRRLQTD